MRKKFSKINNNKKNINIKIKIRYYYYNNIHLNLLTYESDTLLKKIRTLEMIKERGEYPNHKYQ